MRSLDPPAASGRLRLSFHLPVCNFRINRRRAYLYTPEHRTSSPFLGRHRQNVFPAGLLQSPWPCWNSDHFTASKLPAASWPDQWMEKGGPCLPWPADPPPCHPGCSSPPPLPHTKPPSHTLIQWNEGSASQMLQKPLMRAELPCIQKAKHQVLSSARFPTSCLRKEPPPPFVTLSHCQQQLAKVRRNPSTSQPLWNIPTAGLSLRRPFSHQNTWSHLSGARQEPIIWCWGPLCPINQLRFNQRSSRKYKLLKLLICALVFI